MLVQANGFIIFANGVARELIRQGEGLRSTSGWLATTNAGLNTKLRESLRGAAKPPNGEPSEATIILERGEHREPLLVHVAARGHCGNEPASASRSAWAVLIIIDPERYAVARFEAFVGLYGLTGAEARVLHEIVGGKGLIASAAKLGVSESTARTHMQRIFEKTGTNRQTELLRAFFKATLPVTGDNV
jgi:DNA-binding CsgD family transcriptional regulator